MNQQVREKWVKALRSGQYKQTTGALRREEGYCCLGVLCDLYIKDGNQGFWKEETMLNPDQKYRTLVLSRDQASGILPTAVKEWAGLTTSFGNIKSNGKVKYSSLVNMNDGGLNFEKIADVIEQDLIQ